MGHYQRDLAGSGRTSNYAPVFLDIRHIVILD